MAFGLSKFIDRKLSIINVSIYINILDIIDTGQFYKTKSNKNRLIYCLFWSSAFDGLPVSVRGISLSTSKASGTIN
jgi:hypothetical protein